MYSLRLTCKPDEADLVLAELYDAGTIGIRELDEDGSIAFIAGFESNEHRPQLLSDFAEYGPEWYAEDAIDWTKVSQDAWPAREIGSRFFLAPPWSKAPTPEGRIRLVHHPGLACGTGEHPCTRLAIAAIENTVWCGSTVVDVGTGSGLLAIAAVKQGCGRAIGIDNDCAVLKATRENCDLNSVAVGLVCGSADALADGSADITVANISATVLLAIWHDLLRVTRWPGYLILTGFQEAESRVLQELLPDPTVFEEEDWVCFAARLT